MLLQEVDSEKLKCSRYLTIILLDFANQFQRWIKTTILIVNNYHEPRFRGRVEKISEAIMDWVFNAKLIPFMAVHVPEPIWQSYKHVGIQRKLNRDTKSTSLF